MGQCEYRDISKCCQTGVFGIIQSRSKTSLIEDTDIRIKPEWIQFSAAASALMVGVLVYLFDRPNSSVYFVPEWWSMADFTPAIFGLLGQYLPTFSHTFAFILLTTAVMTQRRGAALLACAGWLIVNALLELAQHESLAVKIVERLPGWFSDWPLLDNMAAYFLIGRFDPLDLASIFAATIAAYLLISYSTSRGLKYAG